MRGLITDEELAKVIDFLWNREWYVPTHVLQEVLEEIFEDRVCKECGKYPADPPSKLCPGCEAYREHSGCAA